MKGRREEKRLGRMETGRKGAHRLLPPIINLVPCCYKILALTSTIQFCKVILLNEYVA